jgi:hypothetical protein
MSSSSKSSSVGSIITIFHSAIAMPRDRLCEEWAARLTRMWQPLVLFVFPGAVEKERPSTGCRRPSGARCGLRQFAT